jgi:tetrathionate reductase subunit B
MIMIDNSLNRREFLTLSSSLMLLTIPVAANPPRPLDQPATSQKRWGLLIDTSKCSSGCDACVNACHIDNGVTGHNRPATDAQWIRKVTVKDKQTQKVTSLPLMCQHCENPPCVDVCPTTASFKRADGIVLVDKHLCIGCRYCMMACPYKARSFIHEKVENQKPHVPRGMGTVESCNLCVKRVDEGKLPACVEACKNAGHNAILFGDLKDQNSEISQRLQKVSSTALRADMGLNTGVRYENL